MSTTPIPARPHVTAVAMAGVAAGLLLTTYLADWIQAREAASLREPRTAEKREEAAGREPRPPEASLWGYTRNSLGHGIWKSRYAQGGYTLFHAISPIVLVLLVILHRGTVRGAGFAFMGLIGLVLLHAAATERAAALPFIEAAQKAPFAMSSLVSACAAGLLLGYAGCCAANPTPRLRVATAVAATFWLAGILGASFWAGDYQRLQSHLQKMVWTPPGWAQLDSFRMAQLVFYASIALLGFSAAVAGAGKSAPARGLFRSAQTATLIAYAFPLLVPAAMECLGSRHPYSGVQILAQLGDAPYEMACVLLLWAGVGESLRETSISAAPVAAAVPPAPGAYVPPSPRAFP